MLAFALPQRARAGAGADPADLADPSLDDAREALSYWERRACSLPRHAVRRRREARALAARWQARVAEAERAAYGRGLVGALILLAAEGRLPERARQRGRRIARRTSQAATVAVVALLTLIVAAALVAAEAVAALVRAVA